MAQGTPIGLLLTLTQASGASSGGGSPPGQESGQGGLGTPIGLLLALTQSTGGSSGGGSPSSPTPHASGMTLFMCGAAPVSSGIDLFLCSPGVDASLNLYLNAAGRQGTFSTDLFVHGSLNSGVFSSATLYASGEQVLSQGLPLTLLGHPSHNASGAITLWLDGVTHRGNASLDLYLENIGTDASVPLYVRGSGIGDGGLPFDRWLNLYLHRNTADAVTLYTKGPGAPSSGTLPLLILGHEGLTLTAPLSVPDVVGAPSSGIRLYTHGW